MSAPERVLDAVGEPNRRHLLTLLHERGESTVSDLVEKSGLNQPSVSKHLKVLNEAALVQVRPEGRHRHYRLEPTGLQAAYEWFASFEDVWQGRFDALDRLVSDDDPSDAGNSTDPAGRAPADTNRSTT